ncbi:hypothetical protein LUZ63_023324 [Rhynchospora breviuscula]|uniref:DNA topoisomerase 2 n=1 Tax=Rhynchospora breviuscula TaxID=2022672 RepID=A0A9P9Z340_9POAL|nr:hypothetical protein LUZ63_023324 [Rhynchospora breviuscula]
MFPLCRTRMTFRCARTTTPPGRVSARRCRGPRLRWEIVTSEYSAHHLQVLEGLEAVRKRPGMYIGSTDSRGLMHCLWEIIDNSVDEALAGHGSRIEIVLHRDGSVEVRDRARGIPVDVEPRTGLTGVEVVFTKLHAGGKFGGGSYAASGGLHGVGASVVNALSERLDVEVDRGGKTYAMSFHRGEPGMFAGDGPDSTFTPYDASSELRIVGKAPRGATGTRIRYWADRQIFTKDAAFGFDELVQRARQTAFLVPGLEIVITDERGDEPVETSYRFDGGISEFADFLAPDSAITDTWRLTGTGTFTETVPVLQPGGSMVPTEVAARVRGRRGGALGNRLRHDHPVVEQNARKLKVGSDKIEKDDILAGLTAVLTVRLPEPQFEGQTKEVLGTPAVRQIVTQVVSKELTERFASTQARRQGADRTPSREGRLRDEGAHLRAHPQRDAASQERARILVAAVEARRLPVERRRRLRALHRRGQLGTGHRPRRPQQRLSGAASDPRQDPQHAEGVDQRHAVQRRVRVDHPGDRGGVRPLVRSRYRALRQGHPDERRRRRRRAHPYPAAHALLPLHASARRGRSRLRRGSALARVIVVNPGSKPNETIYTYSEQELHALLAKLKKANKRWQEPIQRYKGLGEMDADQLATTTMDRAGRTLRRVQVRDIEEAAKVFDLLMGSEVAPRREFIVDSSDRLARERIDV